MTEQKNENFINSSFRDPDGFLFYRAGILYRQINKTYEKNYDLLISSGLYEKLKNANLVISHSEASFRLKKNDDAYKIIKPEQLNFISYPYERRFSQLKKAALLTLEIQKIALQYGMTLKDCSAYNIQFLKGKPILIDTLSFEIFKKDEPWTAYKQFCQHFLAPLALTAFKDIRLNQLSRIFIDGIPLDLTSKLLPLKTWFRLSILMHIHLHAMSQKYFSDKKVNISKKKMSALSLYHLVDNLSHAINKLEWGFGETEWGNYYLHTNYSDVSFESKKNILENFLSKIDSKLIWDLGGNDGTFSRVASDRGIQVVSLDIDPAAVEKNYRLMSKKNISNIFPILIDLTNPSPGIGWENNERLSLIERSKNDTLLALALIHHLAISNSLPFLKIASFFSSLCEKLIIEFIPKNDSQVQRLLRSRKDIFNKYDKANFEVEFEKYFEIIECMKIENSERFLYLMKKRKL